MVLSQLAFKYFNQALIYLLKIDHVPETVGAMDRAASTWRLDGGESRDRGRKVSSAALAIIA